MSITDFDNALRSKLVQDFKATGLNKMYVDSLYWQSIMPEDGYEEMMKNVEVDNADNALHDYYLRVIDIAEMDAMTKRHRLIWHLIERRSVSNRPDWAELCFQGVKELEY